MGNAQEHVWAFDLGKASIGEAVRQGNGFKHKASLLIPYDFAETKSAANRRRMWRTRQAHKARESWLEKVWTEAGLSALSKKRWDKKRKAFYPAESDYRLKREFAPAEFKRDKNTGERRKVSYPSGNAKDNASALNREDFDTCYTSSLLRIKLLRGDSDLKEWQIYKALHSSIQKRGYGRVPWAAREVKRTGKTDEETDKELAKKDPAYAAAIEAWPKYKQQFGNPDVHFPCYFDAWKMGLCDPSQPQALKFFTTCNAGSTRRVRFDRADVEREIELLANQAAERLKPLQFAFQRIKETGWRQSNAASAEGLLPVNAKTFGEFLVHGPAGKPSDEVMEDFSRYLKFRESSKIHPGSPGDWLGATAQKIPRFDNRIVNPCALLPSNRFQVCKAEPRLNKTTAQAFPDSLLHCEAVCLMKLKNLRVEKDGVQRKLLPQELRAIFEKLRADVLSVKADTKNWSQKVADKFGITGSEWGAKKRFAHLGLRPLAGHEDVKPPNVGGRSRYSRPALRLIRALVLGGQKPSEFKARLIGREKALLEDLELDIRNEPLPQRNRINGHCEPQRRPYLLPDDLKFLDGLIKSGDSWDDLHFPEQRLDALEARCILNNGEVDRVAAISQLLGEVNDPVVRHRLGIFAARLQSLRDRFGPPQEIVLEFVREDFMGEKAKRGLADFQKKREALKKHAREQADELGVTERSGRLKYELFEIQSYSCLYCGQLIGQGELSNCDIDHIVPRRHGGPDAMLNYALAHRRCNDEKAERTPYQWLAHTDAWRPYEQRVLACSTLLRNKKVQLLLREDAPALVERYTALAETAWVAKLAQRIASLYFGWRNGNDTDGRKRVLVVSGGLTGRIRRRYHLNSLLNPMPANWVDDALQAATEMKGSFLSAEEQHWVRKQAEFDWESKADKNRSDDRHHALDAMVISFLDHRTRNQMSAGFLRFPETVHENAKEFFGKEIKDVVPQFLFFEKPKLAETIYGREKPNAGKIVQRVPLKGLVLKSLGPGKTKFDLAYARKQAKCIRDQKIRTLVEDFLDTQPDQGGWDAFCDRLVLKQRDGSAGSRVMKVIVDVGEATEFANLAKDRAPDRRGAWRKAKQGHRGQIVYHDALGKPRIRPVYVFERIGNVQREIAAEGGKFYGFFRSGCLVRIEKAIPHDTTPVQPGILRLNTIRADGNMVVTDGSGKITLPIAIKKFIDAELKPIHAMQTVKQAVERKVEQKSEQLSRIAAA